ncbi:unnamed protein product [Prunus armeniaca]|uniref:Nudix hydrolase domain-containing protein n=1 Tax=Prunus armeniaca TaxID=36596 RepID=A0A6J5X6L0_PRUAR|nr:unnamed protein product [Prunus armeniaca]
MSQFWKPGAEKPRLVDDEEGGVLFFSSPSGYANIERQRQRLPVYKYRTSILYLVETHATTIIVGETGSGKTTQIPQYLKEAGWADGGRVIACTQPRRLAVQSVASRVAEEMGVKLGEEVGYTIRFEDVTNTGVTMIKFLTDGVLLREMMNDPLLTKYSVIMIDEAHERSISTDILLGLLKKIQRRRPELRLIISSATIQAKSMSAFFQTSKRRRRPEGEELGPNMEPAVLSVEPANSCVGSQRLSALAQQLRLYKPPPFSSDDDIEEQRIEEITHKVVSQVGFAESNTPVAQDPERFRPKRAAVLLCLFEGDAGDLRVILTKRSSKLSTHSGEVALPGGKREEGDKDDGDTATREAKEEIGLDPSLVNVVTVLEPFLSKHLLRVVPVIGILNEKEAFKAAPNPAEVEAVFDAPLEMFIKDENRRSEEREWMGNKYLIHFFDYEAKNKKYIIWGLTAGILIRAASIVYKRSPPFVEQNPIYKVPRVVDINTTIP